MTNRSLYYRSLCYESSSDPVFTCSLLKPNHCATAVQRSLLKAGIETMAPYVVTSPVGGVVSQGMAFPYTPHSAYNHIKFNNPGREITK